MKALALSSTDAELIAYVDAWVALLEREDYTGAFAHTDHVAHMHWTPALVRDAIKRYGEARPDQRVTLDGVPSDVTQNRSVTRWTQPRPAGIGEIWYDLNIDGVASDLTATFYIVRDRDGLKLQLNDIHVM